MRIRHLSPAARRLRQAAPAEDARLPQRPVLPPLAQSDRAALDRSLSENPDRGFADTRPDPRASERENAQP
jgi:hypothetical protein